MDDSKQRRRSEIGAAVPFECSERFVPVPLVPIRRIDAVELSQQGRPGEAAVAVGPIGSRPHLVEGCFHHVLRRVDQLGIAGQRHDLHFAGALQAEQRIECRGHGPPDHEQSVVAQDHGFVIAEIRHQPLAPDPSPLPPTDPA